MAFYSSGSAEVDAMGHVLITGNVVPPRWYKEILRDNGKPDHLAIGILSDIVYWYRPVEVRDEASGMPIGWRKKFKGEYLQKTYEQLHDKFGDEKRVIKVSMDRLENLGLIKRIFKTEILPNGSKVPNVMYISIIPERIAAISEEQIDTVTEVADQVKNVPEISDPTFGQNVQRLEPETSEAAKTLDSDGGPTKFRTTSYEKTYDVIRNNVPCPTKKGGDIIRENVPYPTENRMTNTENTIETTKGDYPSIDPGDREDIQGADQMDQIDHMSQEANSYRKYVYDRLNYKWHMENDPYPRNEKYAQLVDLICDVVCAKHHKPIYVNKTEMPAMVVKSRLLKLDESHIEYVMECLDNNPNPDGIESVRSYMLTCLYNAPVTIDSYYQQQYNHDKHRGPEL